VQKEWYQKERDGKNISYVLKVTGCQNVKRVKVTTDYVTGAQIFQKHGNSRRQISDVKPVPNRGPTSVRRHCKHLSARDLCTPGLSTRNDGLL
jgi:hypothetical protein